MNTTQMRFTMVIAVAAVAIAGLLMLTTSSTDLTGQALIQASNDDNVFSIEQSANAQLQMYQENQEFELATYCGDGYVGGDEECDDGNKDNYDGCSAGCVIETCTDSDGGQVKYIRGETNDGYGTFQDECYNDNTVMERYCSDEGYTNAVYLGCENECKVGRCTKE